MSYHVTKITKHGHDIPNMEVFILFDYFKRNQDDNMIKDIYLTEGTSSTKAKKLRQFFLSPITITPRASYKTIHVIILKILRVVLCVVHFI